MPNDPDLMTKVDLVDYAKRLKFVLMRKSREVEYMEKEIRELKQELNTLRNK